MVLPKAIQKQALEAERLIKFEKEISARVNREVASRLDAILMDIQPILNDIEASKQCRDLSFGTALAGLKAGYLLSNDRLEQSDTPEAFIFVGHDNFYISENGIEPRIWLPTRDDLITDDWSSYHPEKS